MYFPSFVKKKKKNLDTKCWREMPSDLRKTWHSCLPSILHAWVLLIEPHRTQVTVLPDTKAAQHGPRNNYSRLTDAQDLNGGSDHKSLHEHKSPGGYLKPESYLPTITHRCLDVPSCACKSLFVLLLEKGDGSNRSWCACWSEPDILKHPKLTDNSVTIKVQRD